MEYRKIAIETRDTKLVARLRHILEKEIVRITDDSKRYEHVRFMGGPPIEFYLTIITLAGSFASIAGLLYTSMRDRKSKRSILLRFNGKKMKIDGSWSKEEIYHILSKFSKTVTESERIKVTSLIDKEKKNELKNRLVELEGYIRDYQEIVTGFEHMPKLKKWQQQRKLEYAKKLKKFKRESNKIKEMLENKSAV